MVVVAGQPGSGAAVVTMSTLETRLFDWKYDYFHFMNNQVVPMKTHFDKQGHHYQIAGVTSVS